MTSHRFASLAAIAALMSVALAAGSLQPRSDPEAVRILARYVEAVGGAAAVNAVTSRVTRGTFTNGRGQSMPFVAYFKAPRHIATVLGRSSIDDPMGSGRAYDGTIGWDKNFIGTGLRDLTGSELDALVRGAVAFPIVNLAEMCRALVVEAPSAPGPDAIVRCDLADGIDRWFFDRATGLAVRHEASVENSPRTTVTYFEDYRRADAVVVPFRTRTVLPNITVTYVADSIRHQVTVDDAVFRRPRR